MWSSQYTNHFGNIPSNSHRLSLYIDIDEYNNNQPILLDKIINIIKYDINNNTISSDNGSNIIINMNIDIDTDDDEINKKLNILNNIRKEIEKIYYNNKPIVLIKDNESSSFTSSKILLDFIEHIDDEPKKEYATELSYLSKKIYMTLCCNTIHNKILSCILDNQNYNKIFDTFILSYLDTRERTLQTTLQLIENYGNKIKIGIGSNIPLDELHWILYRLPERSISIVLLGYMNNIPHLRLTEIETCHMYGANTLFIVRSKDLLQPSERLDYISDMASKYNIKSLPVFMLKVLLQLGSILGITIEDFDTDFITNKIFSLKHPFVYRREFVGPTDVYRFIISEDDMEIIKAKSEEYELIKDETWKKFALQRAPRRILSF
jgi:hypothetical protein